MRLVVRRGRDFARGTRSATESSGKSRSVHTSKSRYRLHALTMMRVDGETTRPCRELRPRLLGSHELPAHIIIFISSPLSSSFFARHVYTCTDRPIAHTGRDNQDKEGSLRSHQTIKLARGTGRLCSFSLPLPLHPNPRLTLCGTGRGGDSDPTPLLPSPRPLSPNHPTASRASSEPQQAQAGTWPRSVTAPRRRSHRSICLPPPRIHAHCTRGESRRARSCSSTR